MEENSTEKLKPTKRLVGLNILTFSCIFLLQWTNVMVEIDLSTISMPKLNTYLIVGTILFVIMMIYSGLIHNKEYIYEGSILDAIPHKRIIFATILGYCVIVISILLNVINLILPRKNLSPNSSFLNFAIFSTYIIAFTFLTSLGIQIYFYSKTKYVLLFPILIFAIELYLVFSANQLIKLFGTPLIILMQLLTTTIVMYKNV